MPIYPAVALLLGCGVVAAGDSIRVESRIVAAIAGVAALAIGAILFYVRGIATPGDISSALAQGEFSSYTLSMGHMNDLTIRSFAYLRLPLVVAGIAFLIGAIGAAGLRGKRSLFAVALMMVMFLQAARLALVVFDPYLSSRPIAEALTKSPKGTLITYGEHNAISSLYFYTEDRGLLLNGRDFNLSYGSYAPDAPQVFIKDDDFSRLWLQPERYYLALFNEIIPRVEKLVPADRLYLIASSGGKTLFCNQPVAAAGLTMTSPTPTESSSH